MLRIPFALSLVSAAMVGACGLVFDTDVLVSERGDPVEDGGADDARAGDDAPSDAPRTSDAPSLADVDIPDGAAPYFVDEFLRAPSPQLGNGWTEKTDSAWEIDQSRALKVGSGLSYRDNVVYRADQTVLDVDIAEELLAIEIPTRSTSLQARIQPSTVATANTLDSYCVFIINDEEGNIGRQTGTLPAAVRVTFPLSEKLAAGTTYRMRLRVKDAPGGASVDLFASVEKKLGPNSYVPIGAAQTSDSSPLGAGYVGFSGDTNADRDFAVTRFEASALP